MDSTWTSSGSPQLFDYSSGSAKEWFVRVVKYILEGLVVAIAAKFIPSWDKRFGLGTKLEWTEIGAIAAVAAVTFAILDIASPSIGMAARQGAGLALGVRAAGVQVPTMQYTSAPAQPVMTMPSMPAAL